MGQQITITVPDGFAIGKDKHTGLPTVRVNVPSIVAQSGARRWLAQRALHLPESIVQMIAPAVQAHAEKLAADNHEQIPTAEDWIRGVELTLVDFVYDGVILPAVNKL